MIGPCCEFTAAELGDTVAIISIAAGSPNAVENVTLIADPCGGYVDTYCLAPHHRLLTADLRWVPAGDIAEGDELFAFEEYARPGNRNRRWQWATVTHSEPAVKECVRVHMANGDAIECSRDHPWLAGLNREGAERKWVAAHRLFNRGPLRVTKALEPWEPAASFEAGWLSGMLDGEGSLVFGKGGARLTVSQLPGPVMDAMKERFESLKCDVSIISHPSNAADQLHILGGLSESLRALGILRPIRLLRNFRASPIDERFIKTARYAEVIAVEEIGPRTVQSIATSTGTYIGEGYLMHNSDSYDDCTSGTMSAAEYLIESIPAGHTLVIDAHEKTVRVYQDGTNTVVGGMDALSFIGLFDWITAAGECCVSLCVDAENGLVNSNTTITANTYDREL